jgi:DNA-binding transcriptional MocR family regulator
MEAGFVFAPGSLFNPDQSPSTWMRFNAATSSHPQMLKFLGRAIDKAAVGKRAA